LPLSQVKDLYSSLGSVFACLMDLYSDWIVSRVRVGPGRSDTMTKDPTMIAHIHFADKQTLARLNSAVMVVMVGSGLASCAIGALVYDVGRLFLVW
jgi:hypothetical protein